MIDRAEEVEEALPATSVCVAVIDHDPSVRVVRSQLPVVALAVNWQEAESEPLVAVIVTDAPVSSAARLMFGVESPVMLSDVDVPVSEATTRSSVVGAAGAEVSITMASAPAMLLTPVGTVVEDIALPAVSRTVPMVKLLTVRSADV
jgi:hypothetical protein